MATRVVNCDVTKTWDFCTFETHKQWGPGTDYFELVFECAEGGVPVDVDARMAEVVGDRLKFVRSNLEEAPGRVTVRIAIFERE